MHRLTRSIPQTRRAWAFVAVALLVMVSLVNVLPQRVAAADFVPGNVVVVTTDNLNLRSDAGTDGAIRATLSINTLLEITDGPRADDGYTWYQVKVLGTGDNAGRTGWVAADYIELEDPTGAEPFQNALGVRVTDGPVNVREAAGTDSIIKTTLDTGAEVPVYGAGTVFANADGHEWIKVLYGNGIQGWIATDYLEPLSYAPNLGSDDGWSTATGVTVVDGPVNVRDEPSLDGDIVGTLATGRNVSVNANSDLTSADGHTWVRISAPNAAPKDGWVATDFLQPVTDVPCSDGACYPDEYAGFLNADQAVVVGGPVNFRGKAGTDGEILQTLDDGDYVFMVTGDSKFTEEIDGYYWLRVSVGGEDGFIAVNFLDPVE